MEICKIAQLDKCILTQSLNLKRYEVSDSLRIQGLIIWLCSTSVDIAEIGQAKPIVSVQDKDLTLSCAEAYLKTTEWLRLNKGGY